MSRRITDPANPNYSFGLDFNYDVWTADTEVTLCNVNWNNDYRDVVHFESDDALNGYIDANGERNIRIENMNYASVGAPIRINIPFNKAFTFNYLRASNPIQPVPGGDVQRDYYYFILDVERSAANTTIVTVELDVWQTFIRRSSFGSCYLERGHYGVAASNAFDNYGRDYLTIPEPLDIGGSMVTIAKRTEDVMRAVEWVQVPGGTTDKDNYDIMVVSTVDLLADPGTKEKPELSAARGGTVQGMNSGASIYIFEPTTSGGSGGWLSFLATLHRFPWLTSGIVSITAVPKITRYEPLYEYSTEGPSLPPPWMIPKLYKLATNWRNSAEILDKIPARYRSLKKFLTSPYMVIEMTTNTGTSVILNPEAWNNDDIEVMERVNYLPPAQRVVFYPRGYNSLTKNWESLNGSLPAPYNQKDGDDYGDYLGVSTQFASFPQMPSVSNNAAIALASGTHSMAASKSSAQWAQNRTNESTRIGYANEMMGINTQRKIGNRGMTADAMSNQITNDTLGKQQVLNGISGIAGGVAGGLTGGLPGAAVGLVSGVAGAVTGHISTGITQDANTQQLANRQGAQRDTMKFSDSTARSVAGTNKSLAEYSSRGDYSDAIAGIDAKAQDMLMTPPSMAGQFGGDTLNFAYDGLGLSVRWKMPDASAIARVGEYWLRYGYAMNRFVRLPKSLMVMTKFTYWKLTETYIVSAAMPEFFKQAIRGILEKGVTVWANADDIGMIDMADNEPLPNITI